MDVKHALVAWLKDFPQSFMVAWFLLLAILAVVNNNYSLLSITWAVVGIVGLFIIDYFVIYRNRKQVK